MTKSFKTERLQKELQKIVNAMFQGDIADPRLSGIEITKIKISPDRTQMKIYFAGHPSEIPQEKIIELLIKSSGFIKKQIAGANIMRTIPQISFQHDATNKRVEKIEEIFKTIAAQKKNHNYYDNDNDNEYYDDDEELDENELDDYDDYNEDINDDIEFEYDEIDDDDDE